MLHIGSLVSDTACFSRFFDNCSVVFCKFRRPTRALSGGSAVCYSWAGLETRQADGRSD
jgi:hypothetical protein